MKHWRSKQTHLSCARRQRGFSLLELMIGITILGILLGYGVPMFREVIQSNRIVAQNNDFISALSVARSEAIKRSNAVTICASTNGTACSGASIWTSGWITFVDTNTNGDLDGSEVVMQQSGTMAGGLILESTTLSSVRYTASGMLNGSAGTFLLKKSGCTTTTGTQARQIAVTATGRVSTTKVNCS